MIQSISSGGFEARLVGEEASPLHPLVDETLASILTECLYLM